MDRTAFSSLDLPQLREAFGHRLQEKAPLARFSAARVGGDADVLIEVRSVDELVETVSLCWRKEWPFVVLGGGSNVLISDLGIRELVLVNRAQQVRFDKYESAPAVWAESGANFGALARQAARRGLSGLEWAAGIPGTVGGAVVGNAGAHDGDMSGNLILAEILHHFGSGEDTVIHRESWTREQFNFEYRSCALKRKPGWAVVLTALLRLEASTIESVQSKIDQFIVHRRRTQPPGASMGSMFKNPVGDYAGRLIDAAGLKGKQIGGAQISNLHANFFINQGDATARDIYELINLARRTVADRFGISLELEIELMGEW